MSHPNTDRDERVRQIERWLMLHTSQNSDPYADLSRAFSEIRYLLSLLDSQAAESDEWRTVAEKYQALVARTETDTATRMRDRCVAKVREATPGIVACRPHSQIADLMSRLIVELEQERL